MIKIKGTSKEQVMNTKFLIKILFAINFLFLGCSKTCKNDNATTLVVGTNANLPPFEFIGLNGEPEGFDIDIAHHLGKLLQKKIVIKEFDFDALILALQKGQIDIIISAMSITPSRQKEIDMIPYQTDAIKEIAFITKEPLAKADYNELINQSKQKNLPISVQAGHFFENFLTSLGIKLTLLAGPPEQLLDVKYQKSLAAALDPISADELVNNHPELFVTKIALPTEHWNYGNGIGVSKKNKELQKEIEKAIENLRNNGTINSLELKWFKGKE